MRSSPIKRPHIVMDHGWIRVNGAKQNNLKNIDLRIPLNALTVITGVSGSGKSTVAFDVLYAEGQRRYVESFSAYARQFLDRMEKPDVESIEGIPPTIAIDQSRQVKTSRSTVGTMTELHDHLKLLFAKVSVLHCRRCDRAVEKDTVPSVVARLAQVTEGMPWVLTFPMRLSASLSWAEVKGGLLQAGFHRLLADHSIEEIETIDDFPGEKLEIVADRFVYRRSARRRIANSLEQAFQFGKGLVNLYDVDNGWQCQRFSSHLHCAHCDLSYADPLPNLFSFNSPLGACETCRGFGRVIDIDLDLVTPDPLKSIEDGAIKPWTTKATRWEFRHLLEFCRRRRIPTDKAFIELSEKQRALVIDGDSKYYGVRGWFQWLEGKSYKMHVRVFLSRYRSYVLCGDCQGTRLKPDALDFRINGKNIADVNRMSVGAAHGFFSGLRLSSRDDQVASLVLEEIQRRLQYLVGVGLEYLTLDRQSRTLSGGELERVDLTTAIGSSLVNTLYVLDEPSIGLHPRDSHRLVEILQHLRSNHNTVVVVEHDPEIIKESDYVIDLGPGAGKHGGEVVYAGSYPGLLEDKRSLTAAYLSQRKSIALPSSHRRVMPGRVINIHGARAHNLRSIDVALPLGLLVCVTGVSGSGKSSLVEDVIYRNLKRLKTSPAATVVDCDAISGAERVADVILVDQAPVGTTPRSNPVTYMKVFDAMRRIFAATDLSRLHGYTASTFSFNVEGGRCETCRGEGFEKIEMQFLSDVYTPCSECRGARFREEVLEVTYRGRNIRDVLDLTVAEAVNFFVDQSDIVAGLRPLRQVGLDYLRLGQPLTTLSGGESQRLKLAFHISRARKSGTLFIFDEPTTGLHFHDIERLIWAFRELVEQGHSVMIIEHNLEVIKCADYVIDLGPEGGDGGGEVVAAGPPDTVSRVERSHTGRYLKGRLGQGTEAPFSPTLEKTKPRVVRSRPVGESNGISVVGAKEHNLKNLNLEIPRDRFVVVTGLSGSGKSSLAFDIIYAEGQRRYIDSLSAYARQFIKIMAKPNVDLIAGIPPTVAIEQRLSQGGRNSTVATVTEVYHYLRLLYSKVGQQHCVSCEKPITSLTRSQILDRIGRKFRGKQVTVLGPIVRGRKGYHKDVLLAARRLGYQRARIDGAVVPLTASLLHKGLERYREHDVDIVVGTARAGRGPLEAVVSQGLRLGNGVIHLLCEEGEEIYNQRLFCLRCGIGYEPLDPRLFSFNSRQGACPECHGMGFDWEFDANLLVPDPAQPLAVIVDSLWSQVTEGQRELKRHLNRFVRDVGEVVDVDQPFEGLSEKDRELVLHGRRRPAGIQGLFTVLHKVWERSEGGMAQYLSGLMSEAPCAVCQGRRLNARAQAVRVAGSAIWEVSALAVKDALEHCDTLEGRMGNGGSARDEAILAKIQREIHHKLTFLNEVGLGYLTLDRRAYSLSGGEAQRVRLAAQLGSNLRGVCYILDEPTIGLHTRDNDRLLATLRRLVDGGNTVLVVEHDEATIRAADLIVDLGPGAGLHGGSVVAMGTPREIQENPASLTGAFLKSPRRREWPQRPLADARWLVVHQAREHNLKTLDVAFPIGMWSCVTGVSGSGKSTLIKEVLFKGVKMKLGQNAGRPGACGKITGWEVLERVVEVDQSPIGKTPRSVPASYVGFLDEIRRIFALHPEARMRGYKPSRFSFNVPGGRCDDCAGQGKIKKEMNFLPDVFIGCDTCGGNRFNEETLSVKFDNKNIAEVLNMTVEEAVDFFKAFPKAYRPLRILEEIGMGYMALGQASNTLSGGEAQRIKLAFELGKGSHGKTLYVLDEPTTGLHFHDVEKLIEILHRLVEAGNTVITIEHNLEIIKEADYVVDLGPEGGEDGGFLVASGPPSNLIMNGKISYTARALEAYLAENQNAHTAATA